MKKLVNIHKHLLILLLLIFSHGNIAAQESKTFASINEVLDFAKNKNYSFKNAAFNSQMADITRKAAIGDAFNPKIPSSAQVLDNIDQQVSYLPGQAFGMPEGTYKEVVIGQQYVSTYTIQPQFDIINLANIAQIKTSKINQQLVENQNKLNEQAVYDKINGVYFNILSFQAQKEVLSENINIATAILKIVTQKFNEGIARKQEVNEAEVNLISLQDKLEQVEINTTIQYQTLNLFLENELNTMLVQNIWEYEKTNDVLQTQNNLSTENVSLQRQLAHQEYRSFKYQNVPVLSFVSSFNWQNASNDSSFAKNSNWINYSFLGLKLSYDLPTTVSKYANMKNKKVQIELLKNNEAHSQKENETRNRQMVIEYEKSVKQKQNFKKIHDLKKDTYEKNFNQFKENILPLDKLLISQNDMIISKLNIVSALANIGFNKQKIEINNGF